MLLAEITALAHTAEKTDGINSGTKGVLQMKKCITCPAFRVLYEPIKSKDGVWDLGKAKCAKYGLTTPFITHRKFRTLNCVKGGSVYGTKESSMVFGQ